MGERLPYTQVVAGSNPAPRTGRSGRGAQGWGVPRSPSEPSLCPPAGPPGASHRKSKLPCAPAAHCGEFRFCAVDLVKGGVPPFHTFPPVTRAPNLRFSAILFFRLLGGNGQERRSPTGIARQRETAPTTPPRQSQGAPSPTGIARERKPERPPPISEEARGRPAWSAGLRPASRGSAKRAPTTLAPPISRWSAGLRPASHGSAKPAPTTLATPISRLRQRNLHRRRRATTVERAGRRPALRPSRDPESRPAALRDSRRYAPRCRCERPHRENWPALPGGPGRRGDRNSSPRVALGLDGTFPVHCLFIFRSGGRDAGGHAPSFADPQGVLEDRRGGRFVAGRRVPGRRQRDRRPGRLGCSTHGPPGSG